MSKKILVETSARHIHLTQEDLELLCGKGFELEAKKMLSQPGQFASTTKLDLVGPKHTIAGVSILGPVRKFNQVEVSATDARTLGVNAPVRESGDIVGSAPMKIVNPNYLVDGKPAELVINEGCIVAKRHIHMTPVDAEEFGVKNGDIVDVKISGTGRSVVFGDTVVRVSPKFSLAMHIDTDESNAACAFGEVYGEIVK
ncbi:MAG: phosphate propanoyltransferase [Erysipelotrichaceae bacterium]|jgi:putative phosphotransacetylase|nr:phosphate propanoyltransferase [Erysipelotrichaceae bacterium]MCB9499936.1 phosphate propanoyltransferase [Erysipelotrichaceae bacterium]